jgi:hypothetical protein
MHVFSRVRAIPITTIGMRLPHNRIYEEKVASSKPQALGMVASARGWLNTYFDIRISGMNNIISVMFR